MGIISTIRALVSLLQAHLRFTGLPNAAYQRSIEDGPSLNNLREAKVKQLYLVSFLFSDSMKPMPPVVCVFFLRFQIRTSLLFLAMIIFPYEFDLLSN